MVDYTQSPFPFVPGDISANIPQDKLINTGAMNKAEETFGRIIRSLGNGSFTTAIRDSIRGHNHRGVGNLVPLNNEQHGMTFFTRPNLNLSYDNIKFIRSLTPLLAEDPYSLQRAIRAYLDPEGSRTKYKSELVDPYNPFMPLLENNLISVTGFPDGMVDTYTSQEGLYKEQYSFVDGVPWTFNAYSLSCNFRNIVRDPISYLFYVWTMYSLLVHEGSLDPRPSSILENEVDYQTRIYRLTLDPSRQFVQRINACGVSFPISNPIGAIFNIPSDDKYINRDLDQITIEFKALGQCPYDPILIRDFNDVVEIYNPNMREGYRQSLYEYIPPLYKPMFNYKGYPRINEQDSELEWWISKDDYVNTLAGIVPKKDFYINSKYRKNQ